MAEKDVTIGDLQVALNGTKQSLVDGHIVVTFNAATAADAVDLVNHLGGSASFAVVGSANEAHLRTEVSGILVDIIGPEPLYDAADVVNAWQEQAGS